MVAASVGAPRDPKMDFKELIAMIMKNTAAQEEQTKKMEEQTRRIERQTQELRRQRGEEPPLPEPRGEEPPLPEPRGEEGRSIPPPQPRPPPLQSSSALLHPVPQPLLLDTLPVFLDLPVLDLEPRSLQHWPQLCPWFPAPLSPSTQTSLGCCQTSLLLPLFAASLPLGDRTSLHRFPGEDLGPLRHPPVPRPTLRSALSARWGPMSPVRGPFLAAPEGPTHPQARPCKRAAMDIAGLEAGQRTQLETDLVQKAGDTSSHRVMRMEAEEEVCSFVDLLHKLPGCTEFDEDDVANWLKNAADPGHQLPDDSAIIQSVLHPEDSDSEDPAEEESAEKISHCDAATAGNLLLQYLEQKSDTDPSELLLMKQLRDRAMAKRASHLKQHSVRDFFQPL
ncbi:UNVERIFIED_CONTAM: hypothetical protein FKN15_000503 [Acipenser sinensis]